MLIYWRNNLQTVRQAAKRAKARLSALFKKAASGCAQ